MRLVPCYATDFMVKDEFVEQAQYAKTLSLDPYFGDNGSDSNPGIDLVLK